jgi:hypothetical protein
MVISSIASFGHRLSGERTLIVTRRQRLLKQPMLLAIGSSFIGDYVLIKHGPASFGAGK